MSESVIIPAEMNLIEEVASHIDTSRTDLSDYFVIFPGKRPAHFLRKIIGERTGRSYIPPRIFSMDAAVEFLCAEVLNLRLVEVKSIDAIAILFRLYRRLPERIGGDFFESLQAFLPLGLKMLGELEELRISSVDEKTLGHVLSGLNRRESRLLGEIYRLFYAELNDKGFCTRATKYRYLAEHISDVDFSTYRKVIIGGLYGLTKTEEGIMKHFCDLENSVCIFQDGPGIERLLRSLALNPVTRDGRHDVPSEKPIAPVSADTQGGGQHHDHHVVAGSQRGVPDKVPLQLDIFGAAQESVGRRPTDGREDPVISMYKSPDTHGQVYALSAKFKDLLDRHESLDERTVIVLPDPETLFPVVHETLSLLQPGDYNISLGYPVTRTPVFGFLNSLMQLITSTYDGRYYAPAYLKFVLHPYTKNIRMGGRADLTRILFHTIEEAFHGTKGKRFFSLEDVEDDPDLMDKISRRLSGLAETITSDKIRDHLKNIHDQTIRRFRSFENIGDCARKGIEVLIFVSDHSTAYQHSLFRPFFYSLVQTIQEISNSLVKTERLGSPAEYFNLLRGYVAAASVPFHGTPVRGVQVLGFLETRNLTFDRVFILDLNDDVFPGAAGHAVMLPDTVRSALGLSTHEDRERMMKYYFKLLLRSSREVHCFYVESGKKEKSRFLEQILWARQQKTHHEEIGTDVQSVRYSVRLTNPTPPAIAKTPEVASFLKEFAYNATALDTYLRCGLKFYYQFVLSLDERKEVVGEIKQADIGQFVHKVLARLYGRALGRELGVADLDSETLDSIIDDLFEKDYGDETVGGKYLLKRQIKNHLHEFITKYQYPILSDGPVQILELETKWQVTKNSYRFRGITDRIEMRGAKIFILDYKTGAPSSSLAIRFKKLVPQDRQTWDQAIGSLQLPLYILLYTETRGEAVENIVPAYLLLGKHKIDKNIESLLFDEKGSSRESYGTLEHIILRLVEEIADPQQQFLPTKDFGKNCPRCPFTTICGTQWVLG